MNLRPRIVILDGYTVNPGDLDWRGLEALGELQVFDRTAARDVVARLDSATHALTSKVALTGAQMGQLPQLAYIGVMATGYNIVDITAARERGITVTNVPAYSTNSVAQLVFGHLLNLAHGVGHHGNAVRAGRWSESPDWCFWEHPIVELQGMVMGIVGFGQIGQATAKIAEAFGMRVITATRSPEKVTAPVRCVELDELFGASDVVSLHCPLSEETTHLVNAARLKMMKPSAYLINTSRGPLIDEIALEVALREGRLAGVGLDVLGIEPPSRNHPLATHERVWVTPHIAWATRAARRRLIDVLVDNLQAFVAGNAKNIVSGS